MNVQRFLAPLRIAAVLISTVAVIGCGRSLPPISPDALSPSEVLDLAVSADTQGVLFKWRGPQHDQRAKELRTMDGYRVYRHLLIDESEQADPRIKYDLLTTVADESVIQRDKLREEARAQNRPAHRVKADPSMRQFQFLDETLTPGGRYLYKIVPINQGGYEGAVGQLVKVNFRGEASEITLADNKALEMQANFFSE